VAMALVLRVEQRRSEAAPRGRDGSSPVGSSSVSRARKSGDD
jgi:hypothetical protein